MSSEQTAAREPQNNSQNSPQNNPLGEGRIGKLVCKYAIPCIISLVISALYNIVDQIFIGNQSGQDGVLGNAATNVVFPLIVIATAFALLVGDGCASFLSLALGRNNQDEAKKAVGNSVILLCFLAVLFFILGMTLKPQLLTILSATPDNYSYAYTYLSIIVIGLPFFIVGNGFNSVIRADGSPKYAMLAMSAGAVLNIILDPIMIYTCKLGIAGAAYATITGQIVSAIITVCYLFRMKSVKPDGRDFIPSLEISGRILLLGISSFITQAATAVVAAVMNQALLTYGPDSVYGSDIPQAVIGIVMKVNCIMIYMCVGLAAGSQPIIGYNFGAGNFKRVRQTFKIVTVATLIITAVFFLCFQIYPDFIINIFGQNDGLYMEFARKGFRIFLMLCIPTGIHTIIGLFLQAIGRPVLAIIVSVSRQIVFAVPAILIMSALMGVDGALWSGVVSDGLAFILAIIVFFFALKSIAETENKIDKK